MKIPPSLSNCITGYIWNKVTIGASSTKTYRLQHRKHPNLYLKIDCKQPRRELLEEKRVLEWLLDKLPVAKIILFDEDERNDYLLISEVPGSNSAVLTESINSTELVTLLARGLRMIHRINIDDCPFDRSLDKEIEIAKFNVKHNIVDEDNFDDVRQGKTAEELFKELHILKPHDEDLVFTHGDYCLPNVMINKKRISGFIDLHRAGIADRYKDIALAIRSIGSNIGLVHEQSFLNEYGIVEPDLKKIEYYMLLDEFF